jgi:GTP cyclohydrolase I
MHTEEVLPQEVDELKGHYKQILTLLGEDVEREGLLKTPERVAKAMLTLTKGYRMDPKAVLNSAKFKEEYRQMVIVKDINFYSLCEHHMLPFYGKAHVAYIPNDKVVGISKLARTVEVYAKRPQIQEQMTAQIADAIMNELDAKGAMVMIEAKHLCMSMRGIKKSNAKNLQRIKKL